MEYCSFGRTDMTVSALGFGCWEMGGTYGVRDHRVPPSAMLCLPEIAFVSIQMYFSLDRARRFSL